MSKKSSNNMKRLFRTPILMNFVKKNDASWNHDQWTELLAELKERGYAPFDADQVGEKLEEKKVAYLAKKSI